MIDEGELRFGPSASRLKRTLSGADVDALFAGRFEREDIEMCDNCALRIENNDALTFDGDDPLQMPVYPGGELERELKILRRRHGRERIVLCYPCTDALQEPVCGARVVKLDTTLRESTPAPDDHPRLFAV